jgi:hypothetical protein
MSLKLRTYRSWLSTNEQRDLRKAAFVKTPLWKINIIMLTSQLLKEKNNLVKLVFPWRPRQYRRKITRRKRVNNLSVKMKIGC